MKVWRGNRAARVPMRLRVFGALAVIAVAGFAITSCGDAVGVGHRDLEILWPRNGDTLMDEEVLEARVRGYHLDDYEIYWYVDDSRERRMWNDWNSRTKVAVVDTWFWDWRGRGPYTVGFIAEDRRGREIAHRTVRVYVE
jgi:hypothetical protein